MYEDWLVEASWILWEEDDKIKLGVWKILWITPMEGKEGKAGQDEIIIRPCWLCKVFLAQRGTTERGLPIRGVLCGEGMARFKSELLLNEHHLKQSLVESHSKAERTLLWNLNILNELTARVHQLINTHYKQGSVWLISAAVHLSTQIQWAAHSSTDEIFFLRDNME